MSENKTKEQSLPNVGDILPYTNTHGSICVGEVTELVDINKDGKKMWWRGVDKRTAAPVYYPIRTSIHLKAFSDKEKRSTAIAFAEWKEAHGWYMNIGDKWYSKALKEERTSTELYDLFNSL